ncbi:hypothetical protein LCGC14_1852840, partial [marine sediment metagenome]
MATEPKYPKSYHGGMPITLNVTNPTYQIDVGPGACRDDADSYDLKNTSTITIDITVSGVNGLDTGSEAASTRYYIWIIEDVDSDTIAGLLSISDSAPTMPAGYTIQHNTGSIWNDADSNFQATGLDMLDQDITHVKDIKAHDGTMNIQLPTAGTVNIKGTVGGDWYDPSWGYRVGITSQSVKVNEAITTAYVDLSKLPAEFHTNVNAGGVDIRVTKADGTTEVAREVVFYDAGTDTGELHFDCTGIQTGSDVVWYIYYANAGASDYAIDATYGAENAWDASYQLVSHLQESFLDSTDNDNDGANTNSTDIAGKLGRGRDFNNNADINYGNNASIELTDKMTWSVWAKPEALEAQDVFFFKGHEFYMENSGRIIGNVISSGTNALSDSDVSLVSAGTMYKLDFTYDNSGDRKVRIYLDGAEVGYTAQNAATNTLTDKSAENLLLGVYTGGALRFDGILDEFTLANVQRSANWISTTYNNQNDPATFWGVGSQEEPSTSAANFDVQDQIRAATAQLGGAGAEPDEYSIDGTLAGDSDVAIPTEKAVKTYADTKAPKASPVFTGEATIPTIDLTGGQLKFPASQSASADANTLDDYEEGTWTPDLQFGGLKVGITYDVQVGWYRKVGDKVTCNCYIDLSSKGSSVGIVNVFGLPFTVKNTVGYDTPIEITALSGIPNLS